jgi:hypothetical protein
MVSSSQTNSKDISPTLYSSLISWPIIIGEKKRVRVREGGSYSSSNNSIKRAIVIERQI